MTSLVLLQPLCYVFGAGKNHIYTVYVRYFWQEIHQIYGHIRCIHTVLANPSYVFGAGKNHIRLRCTYGIPSREACGHAVVCGVSGWFCMSHGIKLCKAALQDNCVCVCLCGGVGGGRDSRVTKKGAEHVTFLYFAVFGTRNTFCSLWYKKTIHLRGSGAGAARLSGWGRVDSAHIHFFFAHTFEALKQC